MKELILRTPKNLSFFKRIVKDLSSVIQRQLPKEVAVVALSPAKSRAINRRYRKKDRATNVLSFRYSPAYGEILVCPSVIRAEAKKQKHSFKYQMTWMVLHGMLHLSGLHHEESKTAEKKFVRIERSVLAKVFNGAEEHRHGS